MALTLLAACDDTFDMDMQISFEIDPQEVGLLEASRLEATVINRENEEPVIDYKAVFSFVQNRSGGVLAPVSTRTDGEGRAFCMYKAGAKTGIDVVQVEIDGRQAQTGSILVGEGENADIRLAVRARPVQVRVNGKSRITFSVTLGPDADPVAGMQIQSDIIQNGSGGYFTLMSNATDSLGQAYFVYQAGASPGRDVIQGTLDNGQTVAITIVVR